MIGAMTIVWFKKAPKRDCETFNLIESLENLLLDGFTGAVWKAHISLFVVLASH